MKRLYKKAAHLRAHTWKDIGGIGGLLLDAAFFIFLAIVSVVMTVVGLIVVALVYLVHPVLDLLSLSGGLKKTDPKEPTLPL